MKILLLLMPILLLQPKTINGRVGKAKPGLTVYNIKDFGATGDGRTIDGDAINKAIAAAGNAGGGTVYFPAGSYLSYSIRLTNNISIYLDEGATLIAAEATTVKGYDMPEENLGAAVYQDFGHSHWHNSLIWGENLHDISILGPGKIWGRGLTETDKVPQYGGNKSIGLKLCRNVIIRDITILHGGHFGILATGVDNLTISNVKMDTNRDGMDIDCCKNVHLSDCTINSPFDDGICLKSGFGLGYSRSTENVTITNCQVSGYDEGTLLDGTFKKTYKKFQAWTSENSPTGRIKLGTESNGGFKNIVISNCVFEYSRGLNLATVDGGILEDISISNITMRDIVNAPIYLRLGARLRGPSGTTIGTFKRVMLSNIIVYNADSRFGSIIAGIPGHEIEDVRLNNIRIFYKGGGTKEQANRIVPEVEKAYPDPIPHGIIPAYGFYIRHVKNINLNDVEVSYLNQDLRPAFILDSVSNAFFENVKAQTAGHIPCFVLKNVTNASFYQCGTGKNRFFRGSTNYTFK